MRQSDGWLGADLSRHRRRGLSAALILVAALVNAFITWITKHISSAKYRFDRLKTHIDVLTEHVRNRNCKERSQ
jgi:hypothetical protein